MAVGTAPAPRHPRSMVPFIYVLNGTSQRLVVTATLVITRLGIGKKSSGARRAGNNSTGAA